MTTKETSVCKRPYSLGKRLEQSDLKRARILAAARAQLEANGFLRLSLESLARDSGVTRQTVYNLFQNKAGVLEALFDQIALDGGMERMRGVMQQADPEEVLTSFVEVFCDFWSKHRMLLRRIHGIAAMDPELETAVAARNQRRRRAATRIVEMLDRRTAESNAEYRVQRVATLWALTSFEFFDALAESCGSVQQAAKLLRVVVKKAL